VRFLRRKKPSLHLSIFSTREAGGEVFEKEKTLVFHCSKYYFVAFLKQLYE